MSSSVAPGARPRVPGARIAGPERKPQVTGGRRRRLGWLWVGVAAVAASAVGFTFAAQQAGARADVLVVARDVPAGRVLKPSDLRVVRVAADSGVVEVVDRRTVLGRKAKVPLVHGTLLASGHVGGKAGFPPVGMSQVALAVEAGGAPPDLGRGERVAVLPGPGGAADMVRSGEGNEGETTEDAVISAVAGTVTGVKAPESAGGPRVVTVLVETGAARRAAQLEQPRVVVLPAEGREAP